MSFTPFIFNGDVAVNPSTTPEITGYGNLWVNKSVNSNRSNERLDSIVISSGGYNVDKLGNKYLLFTSSSGNNTVKLPNATSLANGWGVTIKNSNSSSVQLVITNFNNVIIKTIIQNKLCEFVLIDNNTSSGTWELIEDTGESNTATNLGSGTGLYKQKVAEDLQFKSLTAGNNILLSSSANEVMITGVNNTASNVGSSVNVYKQKVFENFEFRTLTAGPNVIIIQNEDDIIISSIDTGEVNSATNIGNGIGIYKQKVLEDLQFKSIVAGNGINISDSADEISISSNSYVPNVMYVYKNTTQTIGNTLTNIIWNSIGGSGTLGSAYIFTPGQDTITFNLDGLYKIEVCIGINVTVGLIAGNITFGAYKNGVGISGSELYLAPGTINLTVSESGNINIIESFVSGDVLNIKGINSGVLNLSTVLRSNGCRLIITKLD